MNNLIILGNGFDLAHGMKTKYGDFMNYLFEEHCKDRTKFNELLQVPDDIDDLNMLLQILNSSPRINTTYVRNSPQGETYWDGKYGCEFIQHLVRKKLQKSNWSDIEEEYFDQLKLHDTHNIGNLNNDFNNLKLVLQDYIEIQQENNTAIESFKYFFSLMSDYKSMIINFNYTNTLEALYNEETKNSEIIHIHGELYNEYNPIIFGYAANNEEIKMLIDKNNNDFLLNIKRHAYKRSNQEKKIKKYLEAKKYINVFIIGHSCGISDKLILNEIMNHININRIYIFYHEKVSNFFDSHINLYRIMRNDINYEKIIDFNNSSRIPQADDENNKTTEFQLFTQVLREELVKNFDDLDFIERNRRRNFQQ